MDEELIAIMLRSGMKGPSAITVAQQLLKKSDSSPESLARAELDEFQQIIGTLLISFLRNGCTLLGISTNVQLIVIGAIIIVAVAVDQMARARAK